MEYMLKLFNFVSNNGASTEASSEGLIISLLKNVLWQMSKISCE